MDQRPANSIFRVIEEIDPDAPMTAVMRRMLAFLRNGVSEYWAVDPVDKRIHIHRLHRDGAQDTNALPPDFRQIVAEFFAS